MAKAMSKQQATVDDENRSKVADVAVYETAGGFVAIAARGTAVNGDTVADALRGLGAALREDGDA